MKTLMQALMVIALSGGAAGAAWADASRTFDHSAVHLVAAGEIDGKRYVAVDFKLEPGWKTYWRVPGEAGRPPQFDWTGSRNLALAEVSWPAPGRYHDASGETIGYKDRVIFPVAVEAAVPDKPLNIKLFVHYAVCKDICILAKADLALDLPAQAMSRAASIRVRDYLAKVPRPAAGELRVTDASIVGEDGNRSLQLKLSGVGKDDDVDIFVEGNPDFYFRRPRPAPSVEGAYRLKIDSRKDAALLAGRSLQLTIAAGGRHVVQSVVVK